MDVLNQILNFRLRKLNKIIKKEENMLRLTFKNLDNRIVSFVKEKNNEFNTYHTFIIHCGKKISLKILI